MFREVIVQRGEGRPTSAGFFLSGPGTMELEGKEGGGSDPNCQKQRSGIWCGGAEPTNGREGPPKQRHRKSWARERHYAPSVRKPEEMNGAPNQVGMKNKLKGVTARDRRPGGRSPQQRLLPESATRTRLRRKGGWKNVQDRRG